MSVGAADPGRVVPKRRGAVAVPEPAGDGAQVDARDEQLGRGVMPQRVQVRIDLEAFGQPLEPVRESCTPDSW